MTDAALPEITEVQQLTLKPGDSLIVHVQNWNGMTEQRAAEVQVKVRRALGLPDGFPVLIIGPETSVSVLEHGALSDA